MQALDIYSSVRDLPHPESPRIETTLYELIEVINDEILPGEEELVPQVVQHMFDSGKIKFIGDLKGLGL